MFHRTRKVLNTQEQRDIQQARTEKERKDFHKINGYVPKTNNPEFNKWEAKRGMKHKKI